MTDSIQYTIDSLCAYGPLHDHWALAYSGGKDSSATLTLLVYLIDSGKIPRPKSLTVLYADTRLELLPLWFAASEILEELEERGISVRRVMAPLNDRFMVYILGRGVPPSNNMTFRWCTPQIKIEPMEAAIQEVALHHRLGTLVPGPKGNPVYKGFGEQKLLMITGVRLGESAIRDGRIIASCSKDGGECGQGWFQETMPTALCDTLAPLLHWRVCHVWEWLKHWAPLAEFGDWSTTAIADAYGGDEAEELNARTGCVGCPLAEKDTALDSILKVPRWFYLQPLKRLRPLWRELRKPIHRLRQPGGEKRKDGSLVNNQQRMGPLKLESRLWALDQVLALQQEINEAAKAKQMPCVDLVNDEEEARIRELIAANTWPEKWTGEEPGAEEEFDAYFADGSMQPLLLKGGRNG